jgi:hypothetical protein
VISTGRLFGFIEYWGRELTLHMLGSNVEQLISKPDMMALSRTKQPLLVASADVGAGEAAVLRVDVVARVGSPVAMSWPLGSLEAVDTLDVETALEVRDAEAVETPSMEEVETIILLDVAAAELTVTTVAGIERTVESDVTAGLAAGVVLIELLVDDTTTLLVVVAANDKPALVTDLLRVDMATVLLLTLVLAEGSKRCSTSKTRHNC